MVIALPPRTKDGLTNTGKLKTSISSSRSSGPSTVYPFGILTSNSDNNLSIFFLSSAISIPERGVPNKLTPFFSS